MGIFKKPKVLIITAAAALLVVAAAVAAFVLLLPSKAVGFFGVDPDSPQTRQMQELLEKEGYRICFSDDLADLKSVDCAAWIVRAETDETAQKALDAAGKKVLFIDRKPDLEVPIRFVGYDMEGAGKILAQLISLLPLGGDSNEDGTVSCLVLTGPSGWNTNQWLEGLEGGMSQSSLPIDTLETLSGDFTEDTAKTAVTQILSRYGRDIEVILASSEILAEGAAKAISGRGWTQGVDFYLLSTGTLEKMENRSGMAYIREESYYSLLCDALEDTIHGKAPTEYLLPFDLMNNSAPLQ